MAHDISPTAPEPSEELRQKIYKLLDSQVELSIHGGEQAVYSARYKTPAVTEQLLMLFAAALAKQDTQSRIAELQYVLDNASGGGSWRRIIISRLSELGAERKNV